MLLIDLVPFCTLSLQAFENEDEIDTYQVRYRLSSGDSSANSHTVVGKTWTIITDLHPGMDYTVSLWPQVCGKTGEESPAMAARTQDQGEWQERW